jgi:hypothetical protein
VSVSRKRLPSDAAAGRPQPPKIALVIVSAVMGSLLGGGLPARAEAAPVPGEAAIRKVIADYERAIETKDMALFKAVKPNLSSDEERRLRKAFDSIHSHEVEIEVGSIQVDADAATVHLSRRDTLEGSIVSSFPQTLRMAHGATGWVIEEIGR